jgi:hypothetical protein
MYVNALFTVIGTKQYILTGSDPMIVSYNAVKTNNKTLMSLV